MKNFIFYAFLPVLLLILPLSSYSFFSKWSCISPMRRVAEAAENLKKAADKMEKDYNTFGPDSTEGLKAKEAFNRAKKKFNARSQSKKAKKCMKKKKKTPPPELSIKEVDKNKDQHEFQYPEPLDQKEDQDQDQNQN